MPDAIAPGASTFSAHGLQMEGMTDQALQYADRAIGLAEANPDAKLPLL
jgi:hypothetical protein